VRDQLPIAAAHFRLRVRQRLPGLDQRSLTAQRLHARRREIVQLQVHRREPVVVAVHRQVARPERGAVDQRRDVAPVNDAERLQAEVSGRQLERRAAPGDVGDAHAHVAHERRAVDQREQALAVPRIEDARGSVVG
jgi:hypothetical protein